MHFGAQRLQPLLVAHAEAVLLVDDDQAEILEARMGVQQAMRRDDDVHRAALDAFERRLRFLAGAEARQRFDAHRPVREPIAEVRDVLLREQRGRHEHGHLLARLHGDERRAHRDFGLAEADVAADDAIHRPLALRGPRARCAMASAWSVGFLEREGVREGLVLAARRPAASGPCCALRRA